MNDPYEMYDLPPKRRITTYGKSVKKRPVPTGGTSGAGGSTTEVSAPSAALSRSSSTEPPPRSRPLANPERGKRRPEGSNANQVRRRVPKEINSQPLTTSISLGDGLLPDDGATGKRKLTRTYSERALESTDLYDFPVSPPPALRGPPPKRRSPGRQADENKTPKPTRIAKPVVRSETPPRDDIRMEDAAPQTIMPFSVKTSRSLAGLSMSTDRIAKPKQDIPLRPSREAPVLDRSLTKKRPSPPASSSGSQVAVNPGPRKKRLIDTLAEQAEESEEEDSQPISPPLASSTSKFDVDFTFRDASPPPDSTPQVSRSAPRPAIGTKKTGPKFTYSQQRTMLADDGDLLSLGLGEVVEEANGGSMFNFGRLPQVTTSSRFSFLDEDDETVNTGAVRSLHELRQAGANSRFADEVGDIMDRIGLPSAKPSSLRRGALLELAQKISQQGFRRQFRNHADEGSLLKMLEQEADVIAGYSILAIVITLLAASSSAHLVQQLRAPGFSVLLNRLLGESSDISLLARDKKQNVSKHAQNTLGTIKTSLLGLPIWTPCSPTTLSPRRLALKCLDLLMMQPSHSVGESDIFTPTITDHLFTILSTSLSDAAAWEFPHQEDSTDFYLALYVLETHSINAMESNQGPIWNRKYVPTVVRLLATALRRPSVEYNDTESLAIRLTLNVTNNNSNACLMFVEPGLLRDLARSSCGLFEMVLKSMKEEAFLTKAHETLVLMLAAMINLCAYYPPAARSLEQDRDGSTSTLDKLIRVFAENHSKTSDADSMEKTHLNVALGYLAILLGYLCLSAPIRDRFQVVHPNKSIQPLLDSINEFIAVNHKVAEVQGSQFKAMARLQSLVGQLMA
ncbi:wings apart-like protein 1 [Echria macrotheca]|uniref:Wings apart-like protein 1 n=1 Tax=Echria macrotheca TaxID=438768 RepID=A0AAJ0BLZ1_9PEZI|nr:wings apart-like protein 1 [Echria macrotheca]